MYRTIADILFTVSYMFRLLLKACRDPLVTVGISYIVGIKSTLLAKAISSGRGFDHFKIVFQQRIEQLGL